MKTLFSAYFLFLFLTGCVHVNFIFVAQKWEMFINRWNRLNSTLKSLVIVDVDTKRTNAKVLRWFFALLLISAANYFFFLSQGLFMMSMCYETHRHDSFGEFFFHQSFPEIFKVVPFHMTVALIVLITDSFLHIAWVFNDSFIIMVSLNLAKSFEIFNEKFLINVSVSAFMKRFRITEKLFTFSQQNSSPKFWVEHVEAYKKLCQHVGHTNRILGTAIMISFLTNLYLVCVKLLLSMRFESEYRERSGQVMKERNIKL